MMNRQTAIEWLASVKEFEQTSWDGIGDEWRCEPGAKEQHDQYVATIDLAISEIQMRVAKKPVLKTDEKSFPYYACPTCGGYVEHEIDKFCTNCGQAIDTEAHGKDRIEETKASE